MRKPEVVYVRSGYSPLREAKEPTAPRDIFISRARAMIADLHKTAQGFERLCAAASIRIEEERLRRLAPPPQEEPKANADEDKEQSERVKLLKKILKLERRSNKLSKEISSLIREA